MSRQEIELPMSPYRVLDLTDAKGWWTGKVLGELGADVIKVEPPGGDPGRMQGPFYKDICDAEKSLQWFAYNNNKRGITLNIEKAVGRGIFERLAKKADFIIESFHPGYMDKLGLGYEHLSLSNPRLIMVSITPFGQGGPYMNWKATDIVSMAMGGLMFVAGDADRAPLRMSVDQAHQVASLFAVSGAMIAHHYRQMTGRGQFVDVSIQEAVVNACIPEQLYWDLEKAFFPRQANFMWRGKKRLRHVWQCKDGYVGWRMLVGGLGPRTRAVVDWMAEEGMAGELVDVGWEKQNYETMAVEDNERWCGIFAKFFECHTKAELTAEGAARGAMIYPVNSPRDLLESQQLQARGFWTAVEHDELEDTITYPGPLYKTTEATWAGLRRAPLIGEDNEEVYVREMGMTTRVVEEYRQSGVV